MQKHFGEHLTIDGYGGDRDKLDNKELVFQFLDELPEKLGMKKLMEPVLFSVDANDKKDPGGWTGLVAIAESHLSIHTFPRRAFVTADIYTCKNGMDKEFILKYTKSLFDLQEVEDNFLHRGLMYPKENIH